jgi:hypothetical protein
VKRALAKKQKIAPLFQIMSTISKISGVMLAGVVSGGLSFSAMAGIDTSKLPPASTQTSLTYAADIRPIFQTTCFRCHGGAQHRGGLSLNTVEDVLKGGKDGPIVTVGDGTNSLLVAAISQLDPKTAMPPKHRPRGPGGPGGPGGIGGSGGPGMGGPGGPGGAGPGEPGVAGTNGPAGRPPRRPFGLPAKPLTPEQVGLVRAWIDQGAK